MPNPSFDPAPPATDTAPLVHPGLRFLLAHPAHFIALGAGSGLPRWAPGTCGTLGAWAAFVLLDPWLAPWGWGLLIGSGTLLGWWAATVTAQHQRLPDSSHIVIDEIVAFWLLLWLLAPAGALGQAMAFALFRLFDSVKVGPMAWADRRFKGFGPRGGFGIMLDDFAAAGCALPLVWLGMKLLPP